MVKLFIYVKSESKRKILTVLGLQSGSKNLQGRNSNFMKSFYKTNLQKD